MKKIMTMLLSLVVILSIAGCAKKTTETVPATEPSTTAATDPTTEPTTAPTEPEWEPGTIRAGDLGVVWTTYQRGDKVTVVGKLDNFYIIEDPVTNHLVDSRFMRLSGDEVPEESTGYARYKTMIHSTAYLDDEEPVTLPVNKKVTVLDSNADWMYIQWDEGSGYVLASQISRWPISSGGSSGDGGGGGGDYGSGGGGGGQDGSDVNLGALAFFGGEYSVKPLGNYHGPQYEKMENCEAAILSDGTEGYFQLLRRGDEVKIIAITEESCTLYFDGLEADVPRWAVTFPEDVAYEAWEAYARWNTIVYSEFRCTTELAKFNTNQRVKVVDELANMEQYVVEIDGKIGYVAMDKLSKYPARSQSSDDSGGGDGSGGGGGGGGAEWTPPAL